MNYIKMTKIVASGLLVCAGPVIPTASMAQAPISPPAVIVTQPNGQTHQGELQRLTEELSLTPTQISEIKPVIESAHAQIKPIRQNASLTPDQKRAQIEPIRKQEEIDIRAFLTPSQLATLKSLSKQHHQSTPGTTPTAAG